MLSGDPCAKYIRRLKRSFDIFPPHVIEGTAVSATTGAFSQAQIIGLVLGDRQQIPTVVVGIDIHFFSEMHIRLLDLCTFGCCAVKKLVGANGFIFRFAAVDALNQIVSPELYSHLLLEQIQNACVLWTNMTHGS